MTSQMATQFGGLEFSLFVGWFGFFFDSCEHGASEKIHRPRAGLIMVELR